MPRPKSLPLSTKDLLVLSLLKKRRPGPIDMSALSAQLYRELRTPAPPNWKLTMATTLRRLQERGLAVRQIAGERRNTREWILLSSRKGVMR